MDADAGHGRHEEVVHGQLLVLLVPLLHHVRHAVLAHAAQPLQQVLHGAVPLVLARAFPVQQDAVAHLGHGAVVGQGVEADAWGNEV